MKRDAYMNTATAARIAASARLSVIDVPASWSETETLPTHPGGLMQTLTDPPARFSAVGAPGPRQGRRISGARRRFPGPNGAVRQPLE
jgi:hypothetical protein